MVKLGKSNLQKEEDERREKVLSPTLRFGDAARSALGLKIVRFENDEVMRGLSTVVGRIRELVYLTNNKLSPN